MDIIPQSGVVKLQAYQLNARICAETTFIGDLDNRAFLQLFLSQELVRDNVFNEPLARAAGMQPKGDTVRAKFVNFGKICTPQTINC